MTVTHYPARSGDPDTSLLAAIDVVDSGQAEQQQRWCATQVALHPWHTAKELDRAFQTDGWFHRRLSEAWAKGWVVRGDKRHCGVTTRLAYTWGPPPPAVPFQQALL